MYFEFVYFVYLYINQTLRFRSIMMTCNAIQKNIFLPPVFSKIYNYICGVTKIDKGGTHVRFFLGRGGARLVGADAPKWVLQFKSHVLVHVHVHVHTSIYVQYSTTHAYNYPFCNQFPPM